MSGPAKQLPKGAAQLVVWRRHQPPVTLLTTVQDAEKAQASFATGEDGFAVTSFPDGGGTKAVHCFRCAHIDGVSVEQAGIQIRLMS